MIIATAVPVYIYVEENDHGPYVTAVIVDDENLSLENPELQDDEGNPLKASNYSDAFKVVKQIENTEWPSWEFGF